MAMRIRARRKLSPEDRKRLQSARMLEFKARIVQMGVGAVLREGFYDQGTEYTQLCQEELTRAQVLMDQAVELRELVDKAHEKHTKTRTVVQ